MGIVKSSARETVTKSRLISELTWLKAWYTEALSKAKYQDEVDFFSKALESVESELDMVKGTGNVTKVIGIQGF